MINRSCLLMKEDSERVEDLRPDDNPVPPGLTEEFGVTVGADDNCRDAVQATGAGSRLPQERRVAAGA